MDEQHAATGIVVGIMRDSKTSVVAYGAPGSKDGAKVAGDTIFEIASLTKVFTALLLADAAVRGEVKLDDSLNEYVPRGITVPRFGPRTMNLTDLATHTSGLPLRPDNLHAAPDMINKYAHYTFEQLYSGLPDYPLTHAPGTHFEYSNVGPSLLGQALARRRGTTFADLLRDRITKPLGMSDTRFGDDPAARGRRAEGHDIDLQPIAPTDDGALNPAGGLRSTTRDLLRLLDLFLNGNGPDNLTEAAMLMLTVDRPGDSADTRMALGWRRTRDNGETFYWSDGSGDGSRAFMGFNPARRIAVVALGNASTGLGVDDIGAAVIAPGQTVNLNIPKVHHQIALSPEALDRFVGAYRYGPGDEFIVTHGAFGLLVGSGPSQFPIYPETATRFFAKVGDVELEFSGGLEKPKSALLFQDGKTSTYERVN